MHLQISKKNYQNQLKNCWNFTFQTDICVFWRALIVWSRLLWAFSSFEYAWVHMLCDVWRSDIEKEIQILLAEHVDILVLCSNRFLSFHGTLFRRTVIITDTCSTPTATLNVVFLAWTVLHLVLTAAFRDSLLRCIDQETFVWVINKQLFFFTELQVYFLCEQELLNKGIFCAWYFLSPCAGNPSATLWVSTDSWQGTNFSKDSFLLTWYLRGVIIKTKSIQVDRFESPYRL